MKISSKRLRRSKLKTHKVSEKREKSKLRRKQRKIKRNSRKKEQETVKSKIFEKLFTLKPFSFFHFSLTKWRFRV